MLDRLTKQYVDIIVNRKDIPKLPVGFVIDKQFSPEYVPVITKEDEKRIKQFLSRLVKEIVNENILMENLETLLLVTETDYLFGMLSLVVFHKNSGFFTDGSKIYISIKDYFDKIFLPLFVYHYLQNKQNGELNLTKCLYLAYNQSLLYLCFIIYHEASHILRNHHTYRWLIEYDDKKSKNFDNVKPTLFNIVFDLFINEYFYKLYNCDCFNDKFIFNTSLGLNEVLSLPFGVNQYIFFTFIINTILPVQLFGNVAKDRQKLNQYFNWCEKISKSLLNEFRNEIQYVDVFNSAYASMVFFDGYNKIFEIPKVCVVTDEFKIIVPYKINIVNLTEKDVYLRVINALDKAGYFNFINSLQNQKNNIAKQIVNNIKNQRKQPQQKRRRLSNEEQLRKVAEAVKEASKISKDLAKEIIKEAVKQGIIKNKKDLEKVLEEANKDITDGDDIKQNKEIKKAMEKSKTNRDFANELENFNRKVNEEITNIKNISDTKKQMSGKSGIGGKGIGSGVNGLRIDDLFERLLKYRLNMSKNLFNKVIIAIKNSIGSKGKTIYTLNQYNRKKSMMISDISKKNVIIPMRFEMKSYKCVLIIDTSGSMCDDDIYQAILLYYSAIKNIGEPVLTRIILFHSEVYYDKEFLIKSKRDVEKIIKDMKIESGGTNFGKVLNVLINSFKKDDTFKRDTTYLILSDFEFSDEDIKNMNYFIKKMKKQNNTFILVEYDNGNVENVKII